MSNSRVHLRIHGRVQGVFFRASTMDKARELGLTGWVRNNPDGSVELVAEGCGEGVEKIVEWSHAGAVEAKNFLGVGFYIHPEEEPVLQALPESAMRFPQFGEVSVPEIEGYIEI